MDAVRRGQYLRARRESRRSLGRALVLWAVVTPLLVWRLLDHAPGAAWFLLFLPVAGVETHLRHWRQFRQDFAAEAQEEAARWPTNK